MGAAAASAHRPGCHTRPMSRQQPGFAAVDPPERWPPTRGRFRPERLDAPVDSLAGVGPTLKRRLAKLGLERVGDLLAHRPRRYEEPAPLRRISELWGEEEVLIEGEVAERAVAPRPRPAADPHGAGQRRQRADLRDVVQPAVAAGEAPAGHARAAARRAEPVRLRRPLVRPERRLGDGRLRAGLPGERGGLGGEAARAGLGRARARARRSRPAAGRRSRSRGGCRSRPTPSSRSTGRARSRRPRRAGSRLAFDELLTLQLALARAGGRARGGGRGGAAGPRAS